jgi:hypothetical protein
MDAKRTVISQLTSVGEGALGRLVQNPVAHRALDGALQVKDRVERLIRGVESLERRMEAVERRLDALEARPRRRAAVRRAPKQTTTT